MPLEDFIKVAATEENVSVRIEELEALIPVRQAVELSFRIMAAAEEIDAEAVEEAVKEEMAAAQAKAEAAADGDVETCVCGQPIVGDCTTCDAPCCDSDHCETHCEHV